MKTVFSNSQVCHVFVSQSQDEGRNSNSSIYFQGDRIWSYGGHYLMGKIYADKELILVNSDPWSNTTASHRSELMGAARHLKRIFVPKPDISNGHDENLQFLNEEIEKTFESIIKRRIFHGHYSIKYHLEAIEEFNQYIDLFGLAVTKIKIDSQYLRLLLQFKIEADKRRKELENGADERREKREAAKERKEAKRREYLEKLKESLPEIISRWSSYQELNKDEKQLISKMTLLRIKGDEVFTSKGAQVPLKQAIFYYRKLKAVGDITGDKIGHFTVNKVENDTLKIGCHVIEIKEAKRVLDKYDLYIKEVQEKLSHPSPNAVADYFQNKGIKLSSPDVVVISDLS